jgi:nucleotide-binding universal stress UspA family protein
MTAHRFPPQKVLVATDMSETSAAATDVARRLREQFGSSITVLHAHYFDLPLYFSSGQLTVLKKEIQSLKSGVLRHLREQTEKALGGAADVRVVERPAVEAILEVSESLPADLVVMGTHGRTGAGRVWLGSVAEAVLRRSRRPVLAVRAGARIEQVRSILCPVALNESGRIALEYAVQMAEATQAPLLVVHAVEAGSPRPACSIADEAMRRRCSLEESVVEGEAAAAILKLAGSREPEVIVIGAERKASPFGHIFSSTTQKVMQAAPVPILVVPKAD